MKASFVLLALAAINQPFVGAMETPTPIPTYTQTKTPVPTWTPTPIPTFTFVSKTPVPTQTLTQTPTPVPPTLTPTPISGNLHASVTVGKAEIDVDAFIQAYSTATNIHPGSIRNHIVSKTDAVDVHLYIVGAVANTPAFYPRDTMGITVATHTLNQTADFGAQGTFPVTGVFTEQNPTMQYDCSGCEFQYARNFDAPCDQVMDVLLPKYPLTQATEDSSFRNVLAVMAQLAQTKTPIPTRPPPPTPTSTPVPHTVTPVPTSTAPPPRPDSPQCGQILATLACPRAYPSCFAGKELKLCKSQCTAAQLYCGTATLQGLGLVSASLLDCDNAESFHQGVNSPDTPCMSIFDLGFLFNPVAPCATKTPEPAVEFVPVVSQMNTTTVDGTAAVRTFATVHMTESLISDSKTKLKNSDLDALAKDIQTILGGMSFTNLYVSPYAATSAVKTNGTAVTVYVNGAKVGDKFVQGKDVKAALQAGVATAPWKSRWGESSVEIEIRNGSVSCESCEAQKEDVHATCSAFYDSIYSGGVVAGTATVTSMDSAAFDLLAAPASAVALGQECLSYMTVLACARSYVPCDNGARLKPCASMCNHMTRFCSGDNIGLVKGAPESAGLAEAFECTNADVYVQPGTSEKCWDAYDSQWLVTQPACGADSPPPSVPPPPVTATYKAADPNPATIHVCGGCSNGNTGSELTCPADGSFKFSLLSTRCLELSVGADVCGTINTCGKNSVAADKLAHYKWTGSSANGTLQFYTDSACTTPSSTLSLNEKTCTNRVRLVPGGYSTAKVAFSFDGILTATEKANVEAEMAKTFASKFAGLEVEFVWIDATRRAASSTLEVEFGAPNNVESSGSGKVGADLANDAAELMGTTINDDAAFKAALTAAAGGKAPGAATVTAAPTDSDGSSSVLILIIIIVILLVLVGAAAAVWFFVVAPGRSKAPKVKSASAYDDEEDGYAGRAA